MPTVEFEFDVSMIDGEWVAGGTTTDARSALEEAEHYEAEYSEDGQVTLRFFEKRELTREEMRALLPPNNQIQRVP